MPALHDATIAKDWSELQGTGGWSVRRFTDGRVELRSPKGVTEREFADFWAAWSFFNSPDWIHLKEPARSVQDYSDDEIALPIQPQSLCDWETASKHLRPRPGVVYVEVDDFPTQYTAGGTTFALSELSGRRMMPDSGTVLAVGGEGHCYRDAQDSGGKWHKKRVRIPAITGVQPGDHVCFRPKRGRWYHGFEVKDREGNVVYRAKRQVRAFGLVSETADYTDIQSWSECVPLKINYEDRQIRLTDDPLRPTVLLYRDDVVETDSGLHLKRSYQPPTGTIVAVSKSASEQYWPELGASVVGAPCVYNNLALGTKFATFNASDWPSLGDSIDRLVVIAAEEIEAVYV